MNNHFDFARFARLLRLVLFQERQRVALTIVASLGIALLLILLAHGFGLVNDKLFTLHQDFFLITLFIGGYLFAGSAYPALRQPVTTYRFLMLPASALEKLLVYWLLSALLYPIVYLAVYWLFSLIVNGVAGVVYPAFYRSFALEPEVRWGLLALVLTQSVFLLGAVSFRKVPLIKTFLYASGLIVSMVLGITFFFYGLNTGATFFRRALYLAPYWLSGLALLFGGLTYGTLAEKEA